MWNKWLGITCLVFVLTILFATSTLVSAHADLKSARPAPGEVVTNAPSEIELTFTEAMQDGNISLYSESNQQIATSLQTSPEEATIITSIESTLPEGEYNVIWQATSLDGHTLSGSYNFAYQQKTSDSDTDNSLYMVIGAMSTVLILGSIFWVMYRRRT
jgi:methionine-rich copper-binding protein CopC